VAVIATVFRPEYGALLGLVIGVAMVANLIIAGFFGALIPLVLDRLGQDPATSATIFITTATDVLGFFVFLGLAQAVLLSGPTAPFLHRIPWIDGPRAPRSQTTPRKIWS